MRLLQVPTQHSSGWQLNPEQSGDVTFRKSCDFAKRASISAFGLLPDVQRDSWHTPPQHSSGSQGKLLHVFGNSTNSMVFAGQAVPLQVPAQHSSVAQTKPLHFFGEEPSFCTFTACSGHSS
jgi:hypothetical protein